MLALPEGTRVLDITVGPNLEWQGARVFVALFATMGCQKEAIALGNTSAKASRQGCAS